MKNKTGDVGYILFNDLEIKVKIVNIENGLYVFNYCDDETVRPFLNEDLKTGEFDLSENFIWMFHKN